MKKILAVIFFLFTLLVMPAGVFAQGMMGWTSSPSGTVDSSQTVQEEAEGKTIWDKLQAKQLECKNLTDDNFDVLGEYFMGQSIGNTQRHVLMNQMMKNMMGDTGETQMHITIGKRFSGCDTSAAYPQNGTSFIAPMMWMMGGGGNPMMGYGDWGNMMGWGFGILGWFSMLIFWILLILGVVALIRYLGGSTRSKDKEKSSLDILKERYAKGEIDKKEFEEKKKDLS